jgi:hypothetical protein
MGRGPCSVVRTLTVAWGRLDDPLVACSAGGAGPRGFLLVARC